MSDFGKKIEDLTKLVADLKKSADAKREGAPVDPKNLEKAMETLMEKRLAAQREEMMLEMRKGQYVSPEPDEASNPDEMLVSKSADRKVQEFQKWNDDVLILSKVLRTHPSQLRTFKKNLSGMSELRKAMDTATANEGLEWVPTDFSSDLYDRVRVAAKVAGLFSQINMPTPQYKLPVVKQDATAYLISENTADTGTKATASTPQSNNVTLTAKKLMARVLFSEELREDSIIPVLEFIKNNLAIAIAYGLEDALINGDTAGTHMDSDVTSSTDARKAWDGLRKMAQDSNQVSLSSLTLANLRSMRSKMGKYGADPGKLVWLVSPKGYIKFLGLDEVTTMEKYGPNATVIQGELAKLDGIPIVLSEKMRDDLNATGVNDATSNTKGLVLLAYVPSFVLGNRRRVTMKSRMLEAEDQQELTISWRGAFESWLPEASEPVVIEGVNLAV